MKTIVIYTTFISERFPLLVEYYLDGDSVEINSVRIFRKVVNGGEIYARADGTRRFGPIYEAIWLHGQEGIHNILSGKQLVIITEMVEKELHNPGQFSIPEDQIVYLEAGWTL